MNPRSSSCTVEAPWVWCGILHMAMSHTLASSVVSKGGRVQGGIPDKCGSFLINVFRKLAHLQKPFERRAASTIPMQTPSLVGRTLLSDTRRCVLGRCKVVACCLRACCGSRRSSKLISLAQIFSFRCSGQRRTAVRQAAARHPASPHPQPL